MALMTCFQCGRPNVSSAGVCPGCGLSPQGTYCARCKTPTKTRDQELGCCKSCAGIIKRESSLALERREQQRIENASGNCPECGCRVGIEYLADLDYQKYDQPYATLQHRYAKCRNCGHPLSWHMCSGCRDFCFQLETTSVHFPAGSSYLNHSVHHDAETWSISHCRYCYDYAQKERSAYIEKWDRNHPNFRSTKSSLTILCVIGGAIALAIAFLVLINH